MTVCVPLCWYYIEDHPKQAPNLTAYKVKKPIKESLETIFCNSRNLILLFCFSIYLGICWSFIAAVDYFLRPMNYTTLEVGYIGITMSLTGAVAGAFATVYLEQ